MWCESELLELWKVFGLQVGATCALHVRCLNFWKQLFKTVHRSHSIGLKIKWWTKLSNMMRKTFTFSPVKDSPTLPAVFPRPPCVKANSIKIINQTLDSPAEKCPLLFSPSQSHGWSLSDCSSAEWPVSEGPLLRSSCASGLRSVALKWRSLFIQSVPVCDDRGDDLRHIISSPEGPLVLTDHHMNFSGAPLLPLIPYICLLRSNPKPLSH